MSERLIYGTTTSEASMLPDSLRTALFMLIILVPCIGFDPFPDLSGADTFILSSGNDGALYGTFFVLAAASSATIWVTDRPALRCLATPAFVAFAAWVMITCATSQDVATSIKRVFITGLAAVCASALFLLPRGRNDIARLLSIAGLAITLLCYLGVVFAPHLAIHQASDAGEPQLAGDWRGVFGHKNTASAIFSVLAFMGLFAVRTGRREGWALLVLSLIFVAASGGKSSTGLCMATMGASVMLTRVRSPWLWNVIAFAPLVLLNLFGIGSVLSAPMAALTQALPLDTTFTGRTEIWAFAVPEAKQNLAFGHGIGAFWNTEALRYGAEQSTIWAGGAANAHNGYLDAVLSMGLPGLILMLAALAAQPARDLRRCMARGDEPALTLMLTQVWMFSLYLNSLESFILERASPQWVLLLFAVFGVRYLACFSIKA